MNDHDAHDAKTTHDAKTSRARPGVFAIVTLLAAIVAMSLLVWRITKAWRVEYGGGPRDPRPIPTTGSFGAPGAQPTPPTTSSP